MAGVSGLERPPGWPEPWLGLWRVSHRQLREQGSWVPAHKPLLDEYVRALKMAANAFDAGEGGDRHAKRALAFAVELGLTPKTQKVLRVKAKEAENGEQDPFRSLDELEQKRQAKAG